MTLAQEAADDELEHRVTRQIRIRIRTGHEENERAVECLRRTSWPAKQSTAGKNPQPHPRDGHAGGCDGNGYPLAALEADDRGRAGYVPNELVHLSEGG